MAMNQAHRLQIYNFSGELLEWYRKTSVEILAMNGLDTRGTRGNITWLAREALLVFREEYERIKAGGGQHVAREMPAWQQIKTIRLAGLNQYKECEEGHEDDWRIARDRGDYLGGVEAGVCCSGRSGRSGDASGAAIPDRTQQKVTRTKGRGKR